MCTHACKYVVIDENGVLSRTSFATHEDTYAYAFFGFLNQEIGHLSISDGSLVRLIRSLCFCAILSRPGKIVSILPFCRGTSQL